MRRTLQHLHPLLIALAFLLCSAASLRAQSLTLFNVDISGFPQVSAEYILRDRSGAIVTDADPANFTLTENGLPVTLFQTECPPFPPPAPITALLVCDRSGSMNYRIRDDGPTRFDLLKTGVAAFIRGTTFIPPTTVGISSFNESALIVRDFTADTASLLNAVNGLRANDGTDYNPAFLDPIAGGVRMLASMPETPQRHLIFITDGQPLNDVETDRIIAEAAAAHITVHVITLAMPMHAALQEIALATGGLTFANVVDAETLKGIYTAIAMHVQGIRPCKITWTSSGACVSEGINRELALTYRPWNVTGRTSYQVPPSGRMSIRATPELVYFGDVAENTPVVKDVTLAASGSGFRVTGAEIPIGSPFSIIDWGGTPPPFDLPDGGSRVIKVRFLAPIAGIYTEALQFLTDRCPVRPVLLNGGKVAEGTFTPLELLSPLGGETFGGCDSVTITWGGVGADEKIVIEYSDDNGAIWRPITGNGTGLRHLWHPPGTGSSYKIRISKPGLVRVDTVRTIAGGGTGSSDEALDARMSTPSSLAMSGDLLFVAEEGGHVVKMIDTKNGRYTTIAGTGSPGSSGDGGSAAQAKLYNPSDVAIYDIYLFIADQSNNVVRQVNLNTGLITTVAGNGEAGFSGDGGPARDARLLQPSHVIAARDMLYIADHGNNRIRRVDLKSGTITTVAGGGSASGVGPIPARDAELKGPSGMTIVADPISRNDTLYFAEETGHKIKRLDLRALMLSTAVGTGTGGSSGDGGKGLDARLAFPRDVVAVGPMLYIADTRNYRVREYNRQSGIIRTLAGSGRNGYLGDGGPGPLAAFTFIAGVEWKGPNTVYVSDFNNGVIRSISLGEIGGRDSSAKAFSVTAPQLRASVPGRTVEFGNIAVDASRDSAVAGAICNAGSAPTSIDSVLVEGTDAGDFKVISGVGTGELAAGECATMEIRFQPKGTGRRTARAIVYGRCSLPDTLVLSGTALPSCALTVAELADLGTVELGSSSGEMIVRQAICNNGTVTLDGKAALEPADGPFTIVSGGGAFRLLPGECHEITVKFTPAEDGRTTAQIDYGIASFCGADQTTLLGRGTALHGIDVPPVVAFPALACTTTGHDTAITIRNNGTVPLVITGAELTANDEGFSLLPPIPSTGAPLTILPGTSERLGLRFRPGTYGAKSATLRITSSGAATATQVQLAGRYDRLGLAPDAPLLAFNGETGDFPRDSFIVVRNTGTATLTIGGGSISGDDAGKFELPAGQFPAALSPGDSARILVRVLEPTPGTSYSATLLLGYEPACDTGVAVELFESGNAPALSALPPVFRDLLCAEESYRDTLLVLRNPGGTELRIVSYELRGSGAAAFVFDHTLPITVPALGERSLPIRFLPPATGTFSAELALQSNAPGGESVIPLEGRREISAVELSSDSVALGALLPGTDGSKRVTLRNTGTGTLRIDLPAAAGAFMIGTPSPLILLPGEEKEIEIALRDPAEGEYNDTLLLAGLACDGDLAIPLSASVFLPAYTVVDLPEDTAGPGARVSLPISISIPDRGLFALKGARRFKATISFNGATLSRVEAAGATITAQSYDPRTMIRRITLEGAYPGTGDTLAILFCNVLQSGIPVTPLTFEEFTWDHPHVLPQKLDGSFTVLDTCYTGAIVARPRVLKIRPMPAADEATAEIELDDVQTIRVSISDPLGREVAVVAEGRYKEGRYELPLDLRALPSGGYTLVIDTPFGRTIERIVITR